MLHYFHPSFKIKQSFSFLSEKLSFALNIYIQNYLTKPVIYNFHQQKQFTGRQKHQKILFLGVSVGPSSSPLTFSYTHTHSLHPGSRKLSILQCFLVSIYKNLYQYQNGVNTIDKYVKCAYRPQCLCPQAKVRDTRLKNYSYA